VGISYDGCYADCTVAPVEAIVSIPDELSFQEAAPLMFAGITTYNVLRNSGARAGDVVAGIGGLGHLGIQFASKMGFKTIAIGRGVAASTRSAKKPIYLFIVICTAHKRALSASDVLD